MEMIPNIEYKSVIEEFKDVEARNYAFNNLDEQSQRMEIAWEVLQLLTGDYVEASGKRGMSTYWDDDLVLIAAVSNNSKDFQKKLLKIKKNRCEVCVRGACMLAQIRLGNSVHPQDGSYDMGSAASIKGFAMLDFIRMENSFEYRSDHSVYENHTDEQLANIMCNVLVNGNFKRNDKTNYLTFKK